MSLHIYGQSFKDEVVVRNNKTQIERHPNYQRSRNHTPVRITNQDAFNRFLQRCAEEAERKAQLEDAKERELAYKENRPYRSREAREKLKKEKEQKEKEEEQRRKNNDEAGFAASITYDVNKNYYQILGIDEYATVKEIRKAYKKLALKYHPDKVSSNDKETIEEAERQFKQAKEAYNVLCDSEIRRTYDSARDGMKYKKNSPMNDPEFRAKVEEMREKLKKERLKEMNKKHNKIQVAIHVTLEEVYYGCVKEFSYQKQTMQGTLETVEKSVEVKKGMVNEQRLVFESFGHEGPTMQPGDVHCVINLEDNAKFERQGLKDLKLKSQLCPAYQKGNILYYFSVRSINGEELNICGSYLELLLRGGGRHIQQIKLHGMPDPKAPWFEPPGSLLIKIELSEQAYTFSFAKWCYDPKGIFMIGDNKNMQHAALVAADVNRRYVCNSRKEETLLCICIRFAQHVSDASRVFMSVISLFNKNCVWKEIHIQEWSMNFHCDLLDDEIDLIDQASIAIIDSGSEEGDSPCIIAPIDEDSILDQAALISEYLGNSAKTLQEASSARHHCFYSMVNGPKEGAFSRAEGPFTLTPLGIAEDLQSSERNTIELSAGRAHSAVLHDDGNVSCHGDGAYGQTGQPKPDFTSSFTPIEWDCFVSQPKIESVSCGGQHTLLQDEFGRVWSFGCGRHGQLGVGETMDVNDPQLVWPVGLGEDALGAKCIQISAGGSHSLLLDSLGHAWSWGANNFGQLGLGDTKDRYVPTMLVEEKGKGIEFVWVAAGDMISGFICKRGKAYTCGSSQGRLLGYSATMEPALTPKVLSALSHEPFKEIKFGESIAAASNCANELYVWGSSKVGMPTSNRRQYKVLHSKVVVRASPSVSARMIGLKYKGDVINVLAVKEGWVQLAPESYPQRGPTHMKGPLWMLIDGSVVGLGKLLVNISNSEDKDCVPKKVTFKQQLSKLFLSFECHKNCVLALFEDNTVWTIKCDEHEDGNFFCKQLCYPENYPLYASKISSSSAHAVILPHEFVLPQLKVLNMEVDALDNASSTISVDMDKMHQEEISFVEYMNVEVDLYCPSELQCRVIICTGNATFSEMNNKRAARETHIGGGISYCSSHSFKMESRNTFVLKKFKIHIENWRSNCLLQNVILGCRVGASNTKINAKSYFCPWQVQALSKMQIEVEHEQVYQVLHSSVAVRNKPNEQGDVVHHASPSSRITSSHKIGSWIQLQGSTSINPQYLPIQLSGRELLRPVNETHLNVSKGLDASESEVLVDLYSHRALSYNLYNRILKMYLRGCILVGIGDSIALLGINNENTDGNIRTSSAIIPYVIRPIDASNGGGIKRLHEALLNIPYHPPQQTEEDHHEIFGVPLMKDSAMMWSPAGKVEAVVALEKDKARMMEKLVEQYLHENLLEPQKPSTRDGWVHMLSLRCTKDSYAKLEKKKRLQKERNATLKKIREEEYALMGDVVFERTHFDAFGTERGACTSCEDCKGYLQPFHKGLAGGGSYVFLCACCGCPYSEHAEITH